MNSINPEHRSLVNRIIEDRQAQIRADARSARAAGLPKIHPAAAIVIIVLMVLVMSVTTGDVMPFGLP